MARHPFKLSHQLARLDDEVVAARAVIEVDDARNAERGTLSQRSVDAVRRVGTDDAKDRQDPGKLTERLAAYITSPSPITRVFASQ